MRVEEILLRPFPSLLSLTIRLERDTSRLYSLFLLYRRHTEEAPCRFHGVRIGRINPT
jgi:hypothetical protein